MRAFKAEQLSCLLGSSQKLAVGLDPYLAEISANNIESTFATIQEVARAVRQSVDPIRKINALVAVLRCMEGGNYAAMLFAEVYVAPALTKVVEFLLENRDFHAVAGFLERSGLPANTPHIQNISYNFVALACRFFQTGAIIKPFRVCDGHEYEEPSLFSRWHDKLVKERAKITLNSSETRTEAAKSRQLYISSLGKWAEYADSLIYFFMEMLDGYFGNDSAQKSQPLLEILQYGESIITEETIARLIDIMAYHLSFDVRVKALRLFDRLILWGDVEALLVANFTENIESIIKAFWQVRGERSLDEGSHIYPEIEGQHARKQDFYRFFLMAFQCWAVTYPNHEFLVPTSTVHEPSPIYQLYKLLREKKKTIFPNNPNLVRFETDSRMAMLEKTYRNRLILKDINNHSQLSSVSIVLEHKVKDVQEYYQSHKEVLVNLISKKANPYEAMEKLAEFQLHFQEMVESLSLEQDPGAILDKLIENGLQLIEIVTLIHAPFLQLLHGELTEKQFLEKTMSLCVNYFSPAEESQFTAFYSEKVAHKKESLVEMLRLQKSDPLEKDLKYITNSIMVRQFRHKYRQKLEKMSSSKNSEQSEINLEIFTKTKFTRESREEMERSFKFQKKESFRDTLSPNKDLLKVKNSETPNGGNSLKGSREKKKLSLATKQLENRRKDAMQGQNENRVALPTQLLKMHKIEVTSQTRSSRDKESQKSQRIINHFVSFNENSQYFSFIPNENYKFSYVCHHLLIFKSPFLTVERTIMHDQQHPHKVKVVFHLTTHKLIPDFVFAIEEQECIKIEYQPQALPLNLANNCKFKIQVLGEMRKIPLRLPTIALFIRKQMFFQYILPFTFNFFLRPSPANTATQHYSRLQAQARNRYFTSDLLLSKTLFPQQTLAHLPHLLPGSFILQSSRQIQRHIWLASYGMLSFLFAFQFNINNRTLLIRGLDAKRNDDYNSSMLRYTVNFLARIISERQA